MNDVNGSNTRAKIISDLIQTRSMLRMQVLQSNPSKILHQKMDSNLVVQLKKNSELVHINKLIFLLFLSQLFSTLFFLLFFWTLFFLYIELRTRSDITLAHTFFFKQDTTVSNNLIGSKLTRRMIPVSDFLCRDFR